MMKRKMEMMKRRRRRVRGLKEGVSGKKNEK